MRDMTPAERTAFLMHETRTGKLATVRADGRPHVAPIWYVVDGDDLVFMTWHESVKATNIRRDRRASLCVDFEAPPYAFVIVEGEIDIVDVTDEERVMWAAKIGGRYMGEDQAEAFGARNGVAGELVLRLKPTKIIAKDDLSD